MDQDKNTESSSDGYEILSEAVKRIDDDAGRDFTGDGGGIFVAEVYVGEDIEKRLEELGCGLKETAEEYIERELEDRLPYIARSDVDGVENENTIETFSEIAEKISLSPNKDNQHAGKTVTVVAKF